MHWILGIALAVAVFVILKQWGALSAEKKKAATWKMVLVVGGAVLLFMVLTGRVHVLTAAVAALVPLLRKLPALVRFAPMVNRAGPGPMSVREACDILGVSPDCSGDEVIMAHRRLMQKIHPDRGGNDYLAAKVNEAKATLLASRKGAA